ncbi:hypothetical protein F2P81_008963 [Scophthalmus maximus]|uniref:Uncharacterized protein n=1 Tax=Scophthalmus maximus TaxID=52904 RepID=A0A6A4T0E2_SCOMX|nr:hypothetical protein F2P81_008963 [Scophthalmus maximus]
MVKYSLGNGYKQFQKETTKFETEYVHFMSLSPEIQPNSLPMTPDTRGKFCMVEKMRQNTADFHIFHVFLFCLQALCWKTARSSSEFPVCCKLHVELRRGVGRTASLLNEIRHVSKHKRVHGIHPAFVEARANGQTRHACKQKSCETCDFCLILFTRLRFSQSFLPL